MDLRKSFQKFNIDTFGICDASLYNKETGKSYKTCIVALFPYFCGYPKDYNISIYCHGMDYHLVTRKILTSVANSLGLSEYDVHSDTGPHIDRALALKAGLCFEGKNGLCINDKYGSYFFIGYIACNLDLSLSQPMERKCIGCNKCIDACPGGALGDGLNTERCLSHITQKRGELSSFEEELVKKGELVFGCDICQKVCPHNRDIEHTPIDDFCDNLVTTLSLDKLSSMSNKEFMQKYGDRAFSWRGKKIIERNLKL